MPSPHRSRRAGTLTVVSLATAAVVGLTGFAGPAGARPLPSAATPSSDPVGQLELLTDPFLQLPERAAVSVVWMTEFAGDRHVVLTGDGVAGLGVDQLRAVAEGRPVTGPDRVRRAVARSERLSRVAEDSGSNLPAPERPAPADGIVDREVWRHEARVTGLRPGARVPYRVVSLDDGLVAASGTFSLAPAPQRGAPQRILLTSDHQAMVNTPANLEVAADTVGDIDAVFLAGDLVNIPDRASEWFDDTRGSAFFPALQGNGSRVGTNGLTYRGGEIIQNAPLFPAVGNHEVQGRRAGATSLNASYNAAVPRAVAEEAYEAVAAEVNPTDDPDVRERWIEDNSFSTTTYEEIFTLPESATGGETYYAVTIGDVRLVSLYSTRIWRSPAATPDPAARTATTRYQEARANLEDPLAQGYGEHIFEPVDPGSEQFAWLEEEVTGPQWRKARYRVVILHEGPQGLGDNVMPQFADPVRIEERSEDGTLLGVRYEYPPEGNELLREVQPLLEGAGADLVLNGHSHLWNRFATGSGTNFLETSNTGNSYGAYHPLSGRSRPLPPAPWDAANYLAQGNPGGLEPIVPTENPFRTADGAPQPFVQSNDHVVFTVLDTGTGEVVTWTYDMRTPDVAPVVLDRFGLGR